MSTKNELLAIAKELGIKGRHDMTVAELKVAVKQRQMIEETKPAKRLVKNTNIPWRRKYYFLDVERYEANKEELNKVAGQARLILKFMYENDFTGIDAAAQGETIAEAAIAKGYIKTPIEPKALFAYYRRVMEQYGLVFAGYNLDA